AAGRGPVRRPAGAGRRHAVRGRRGRLLGRRRRRRGAGPPPAVGVGRGAGRVPRRRRRPAARAWPGDAGRGLAGNHPGRPPPDGGGAAVTPSLAEPATWAACLTPAGTAALAVVAVRGPDAWRKLRPLFPPHPRADLP